MGQMKINHIGIVVEDVQTALNFWHGALGLPLERTERNEDEAVEIAFLPLEHGEIELIAPITEDSGVAKYMAKKGAGMHHICIEVDDIAASMTQLAAGGAELINDAPKTRHDGTRYVFVHPKSTGGVL
ncbi:MAG: methylmalonyl-CoA epimerase, partial [Burkholderiales bacterium]|nr:methylmalonyl-CoA epimerase [Anaerolineae bacterium]